MEPTRHPLELPPSALRRVTDPATLGFVTTERLASPSVVIGQDRARAAIELALGIQDGRYNLFVMGDPGVGRADATLTMTREVANTRHVTSDWVYVHNFEQPEEPVALELPAGKGRIFARDVETYIISCRRELRRAFSSDAYSERRAEALKPLLTRRDALLEELQGEARAKGFVIQGTPAGLALLPLKPLPEGSQGEPEPYSPEEFRALPEDEQKRLDANNALVEAAAGRILPQVRAAEDEMRSRVRAMDHDVADGAIRHLSELVAATYAASPEAVRFFRLLRADIVAHSAVMRDGGSEGQRGDGDGEEEPQENPGDIATGLPLDEDLRERPSVRALLRRYSVNVMIAHQPNDTAPVIEETNPTYSNLMGRIDIGMREGLPFTDHMMLRPGAMHKAVGGYLILQAHDVLTANRSWEAVKRMARFGNIELENGSMMVGAAPGATIRPQPIRADVKVILIGDPMAYAVLLEGDPEFRQVFKVRADFDSDMPRDAAAEQAYAQLAGAAVRRAGYPPMSGAAVALVIEEGSRWAEDQTKLTCQLTDISDLCIESGYFAKRAGSSTTDTSHVKTAIVARDRRNDIIAEKSDEAILDKFIMIATSGAVTGQINGLSIRELFGHPFGSPNRITARVSPGAAGVVTVERETDMSGPTHTKGVLVLTGYLAGRFAQQFPLSLSASLCFEQLYTGVDGDSASSAELYALLSALADAPISQAIAVTGSVNQRGEVQAIGGVTEKVEGFFRICAARGLTGEQGVLIPAVNARNLMLRDEVVQAVKDGKFHIYGISTIEEGVQILTGIPFGTLTSDGQYLAGTIAARVLARLAAYSERVRVYGPFGGGAGMTGHGARG